MKSKITRIAAILLGTTLGTHFAHAGETSIPKDYPLKSCPISEESLGSGNMKPLKLVHEGTEVWLCCKACKRHFDKDPAKYVKIVNDARKAAAKAEKK